MNDTANKENNYKYFTLKRSLNSLYKNYKKNIEELGLNTIIIRTPKGLSDYWDNLETLSLACKKMHKRELHVIIRGKLINLTPRLFMILYALLTDRSISGSEYSTVKFRPQKIEAHEKQPRDIVKSICHLKNALRKCYSENDDDFEKEFSKIAKYDDAHNDYEYICSYSKIDVPNFLTRPQAKNKKC